MKAGFEKFNLEIYGESHAPEIGVILDGIPTGTELTLSCVKNLLARRKSVGGVWATPRKEEDEPEIVSGLTRTGDTYTVNGKIEIKIKNNNVRPKDYDETLTTPRPSHADYAAYKKDGRISSGGGRFSGRMTAALCVAGGIAQELLEGAGVRICAYISELAGIVGRGYETDTAIALNGLSEEEEKSIKSSSFPLLGENVREAMQEEIKRAASDGDSVGGVIECVVTGLEAGMLGDALFCGLEGKIAYGIYAIPAVKGVEFGNGFGLASARGSIANDGFIIKDGEVVTATNHGGGINGGISNGMPVIFRVAVKPTPSISKPQRSVNLAYMTECVISVKGRHDACIVPRAVPCVEACTALALLDEALKLRDGIELY